MDAIDSGPDAETKELLWEVGNVFFFTKCIFICNHEVLPSLFHPCNYSYDQLLDGLSFLGANYEKIAELFSAQTSAVYGISTDKTYFDCTNFFFEIDREDEKIRSRVISWSATSLSSWSASCNSMFWKTNIPLRTYLIS